jgi:hypothetical protein
MARFLANVRNNSRQPLHTHQPTKIQSGPHVDTSPKRIYRRWYKTIVSGRRIAFAKRWAVPPHGGSIITDVDDDLSCLFNCMYYKKLWSTLQILISSEGCCGTGIR